MTSRFWDRTTCQWIWDNAGKIWEASISEAKQCIAFSKLAAGIPLWHPKSNYFRHEMGMRQVPKTPDVPGIGIRIPHFFADKNVDRRLDGRIAPTVPFAHTQFLLYFHSGLFRVWFPSTFPQVGPAGPARNARWLLAVQA